MRLSPCLEDRVRFALPEWLDFDLRNISVADMDELSDRYGFDPEDWPAPFLGELTLEQAGDPEAVPKPPRWRNHALCWMLLRQNGIPASWDEAATVKYMMIRTESIAEPEPESPGKEATAATPSPRSAASTTRRSATSTASRRRKST